MSLCFTAEQVFEGARAGTWKRAEAELCGCRGSGWFCSDVDTWHVCHVHRPDCVDCCHPEAGADFCLKDWQGPIQQVAPIDPIDPMDADIPF